MYVIAEIGCNHKGDLGIAMEMVETAAKFCGVDAVKFQKRTPKLCLTEEEYNAPHPNPENSYGKTYGEHREILELNVDDHRKLKLYAHKLGIAYGCSVWDMNALVDVLEAGADFIKIPSAQNSNCLLMEKASGYMIPLHVSMGMTTRDEEKKLLDLLMLNRVKPNYETVIYSCTSGYPVAFEDLCLGEIPRLREKFKYFEIGFSGHHLGIAADIAAMALGAGYIERHFTLNRTWKGTDHAASLEPDGMRKLVRDLKSVEKALKCKPEVGFLPVEEVQRRKLKCLR